MRVALLSAFILTAAALGAQQQQQQSDSAQNRFKVSGTVVNAATGQPVARALVMVDSTKIHTAAFTGEDGRFEVADVPEGPAYFSAQRPGFFSPGVPKGVGPTPVTVGASTTDITLKLTPGGSISGRVLNGDGEPVAGVMVQLLRKQIVNGIRGWQMANGAATDEGGAYRFDDLGEGSYLVHTRIHPVYNGQTELVINGQHLPELYPEVYFPNSPTRDSAQAITVKAGSESSADITVTAAPGYTISGTVSGAQRAAVHCESDTGDQASFVFGGRMRAGEFSVRGVPSGPCHLVARTFDGRDAQLRGELLVNVGSSDISGVHMQVQPSPEIPVIVSEQPEGPGPRVNLRITNVDGQPTPGNQPYVGNRGGDNGAPALAIQNARPGSYRVSGQALGNYCIGTMQSGGTDLLREPLVIPPEGTPGPINVTLRTDCGNLIVKVENAAPQSSGYWFLISGGSLGDHMTRSGSDSFIFPNLTPGDYNVYAFDDASDLEYANPDVMKRFSAQRVTINPGEKATVQLKAQSTGGGT